MPRMNTVARQKNAEFYVGFVFKWVLIGFFFLFTFAPLVWLLVSSFKTNLELQTRPFALPEAWQVVNYLKAVQVAGLPRLFLNSVIVSVLSTTLTMLLTSMAAFAFARERFPFQHLILNLLLTGVLIPIIALMAPYFRLTNALNIYDSLLALILTYAAINIPVSTFLMYNFMRGIPVELEEAAIIDGASFYQRFTRVVFPLSKSGLVTAGTFVFLFSWNEFVYALLLTSSEGARTIQLGIRFFVSQFFTDYTSMFAAIVLTILPSVIVYVIMHEQIIKGLTSGAVKG